MECGGNDAAFEVRETTNTTKFSGMIDNRKERIEHKSV
jgi:hypothetical protein